VAGAGLEDAGVAYDYSQSVAEWTLASCGVYFGDEHAPEAVLGRAVALEDSGRLGGMYVLYVCDPDLRVRRRRRLRLINRALAAMSRRRQMLVLECLLGARIMSNAIQSANDDSDESGGDVI
jgi:hypothetical protein